MVTLASSATIGFPTYFSMTVSSASGLFENTAYMCELMKVTNTRFKVYVHRGGNNVEIVGNYTDGSWGAWEREVSCKEFSISGNGSLELTVSNNSRAFLFTAGANSNVVGVIGVSSTSAGAMTAVKIGGANNISISVATNKVTLTNGTTAGVAVNAIVFLGNIS